MDASAMVVTGVTAFGGALLAGRYLAGRRTDEERRTTERLRGLSPDAPIEAAVPSESIRSFKDALLALGLWLAPKPTTDGPVSKVAVDLRAKLELAGFRQQTAPLAYSVLQLAAVILLAVFAVSVTAAFGASWRKILLFGAAGAGIGLLLPSMLLGSRIAQRKRLIQRAFPDALDIMLLSIEGGASVNAAITWVNDEVATIHPLFAEEWSLVQREVQMGLPPSEAFLLLATRTGLDEIRDFAAALLHSERYGASLSKALRAFVDSARADRQVWAEEVAQKASVKIVFPMLLCIFPAIFIVLLGPAATQMSQLFAR